MGKNKAQRTKNNAKPSNSSRSAQLLGTSVPNFVGFSAVTDGGYVPVLPGLSLGGLSDVAIDAIDSNFQLALKKMNKKDATTKFKALQEFAELCKESDISTVEAVLPFWPRLYCLLSVDVEHRVREAAQTAHAALVKRVGKSIAVYLKQIAGHWFASQFDTYPPAASAATNSFKETFPQRKIVDAIIHCQEEILSYIGDTITVQTPQSMSTNKFLTAEELETKYQKVLIASLQAYSSYLKQVPAQQIEKMEKFHQQIISNNRFWKLPKHESVIVKTAFFNVLASLIENGTVLLKDEKKRTMTAIMNSLDETEPGLLSAVWESMLVAINMIEDWYLSVSIEKLVLPKLWKVLKSGGQCCASVVYPNLLPFVSQFSKFNVDNKILFVNFFTHMRQGFTAKTVLSSRSEMFAVTKSFVECLRYAILLHKNDQDLCVDLVKNQLIPVVELCIVDENTLKSTIFCEVTQLIRYWSKNRQNSDCQTYGELVKIFWHELEIMFNELSKTTTNNERSKIHAFQIDLLLNLKNAPSHSRKNLRVKFSDPEDPIEEKCRKKISNDDDDAKFAEELDGFVNNLCVVYLDDENRRKSVKHMEFVNRLVTNFESERLFDAIAKTHGNEADLFVYYDEVLKNWLVEKTQSIEPIVQFIFSSLSYMNDAKKEAVLKSLIELEDVDILRSAIACALSEKSRNDAIVGKWCLESRVTDQLSDIAREVVEDPDNSEKLNDVENILVSAFATTSNGELCVSEEAIEKIATILCDHVDQELSSHSPNIIEFVSRLLSLTWMHPRMTSGSVKMLKSLFELSFRNLHNSMCTSFEDSLRDTWKCGFVKASERLKIDELRALQRDCLNVIYATMYSSFDPQLDDAVVDVAVDLIESSSNNDPSDSLKTAIDLNVLGDVANGQWIREFLRLVLYAEIINGNYYVTNNSSTTSLGNIVDSVVSIEESSNDRTENCLNWASFNAKLFNKFFAKFNDNDGSDVDSKKIDSSDELRRIIFFIVHITDLGRIYRRHYKSAENYQRVDSTIDNLIADCGILRKSVGEEIWPIDWTAVSSDDANWVDWRGLMSQFSPIFTSYDENTPTNDCKLLKALTEYVEANETSEFEDITAVVNARKIIVVENETTESVKVLERMIRRHQEKSTFLLLDRDISRVDWTALALPINVIRLLSKFVRQAPTKLDSGLWDATVIFLAAWQQSVNKSMHSPDDAKVKALTIAVSELYHEVQSLMIKHKRDKIQELPSTLLDEWQNLFAEDVHHGLANTWMIYANRYNDNRDNLRRTIVLNALGKAISIIDGDVFFKIHDTSSGTQSPRVKWNIIIDLSLKLLTSTNSSLQLSAYHAINRLIPNMVKQDEIRLESETFESNDLNVRKFKNVLSNAQDIVNDVLAEFKLCEDPNCTIQPYTDAYTYTVGYLLTWANVLEMCAHADADLRYLYAEFLKDDYFPFLLNNIFKLIYQIPSVYKTIIPFDVSQNIKTKPSKLMELFRTVPSLELQETWTEWRLDHIVCWVYVNCLRHLPVLVRQWWRTTDSRISVTVQKITTVYVSPMLCQEELLNKKLVDIENMQVKVHPSVREVVALYQMDDTKLELSMILPENHPLGLVTVEPGQHVGGAVNWRNCHMQLSIFLTHHNGSIWDGLLMWKKNLDKKFLGVEECFICYSIFHPNTYQIPKLSCHTCRKKFHAPCLYKWFTTSQKSTCPICRNIF